MAERWWMLLKARLFMGVKVFAVLLTALCAGVSLAGCGRVDSEEGEEQKNLVFYTEDGYYYFQAMEGSTVWYRMPSKDVGISYEEIACLPDALYKDDANVKYKKINYRKDLEEGDKEEDNENQKIEVEGSYLYQDKNVNFTDIWWIKKAEGNLVKCESWRTFDSGQESHAVISIRMGEDCEKIQDFPESYLEITKEDLENGEFGL